MFVPRATLAVAALALAVYLPGLGRETSITQRDEYRLSLRTQAEMLADGHFLTPHLDGKPRLKKPPLVYWVLAASGEVLGRGLFAARLPGVLFALALALATMGIAAETGLSERRRFSAGLLLIASLGAYVMGRMALLDIPMAAFTALSVWCFLRWMREGHTAWILGSALLAALATLAKGPQGPLVVLFAAVARMILFPAPGPRRRFMDPALAVAVFLVAGLAWPAAMAARWGDAFWDTLREEVLIERTRSGPHQPLVGVLALAAPWSLLVVGAAVRAVRDRGVRSREDLWLGIWILASILPFLFLSSRMARYVAPALPAAILLVARRIDGASREGCWSLRATGVLVFLLGLGTAAAGIWFRVGPWWLWLAALGAAAAAAAYLVKADLVRGPAFFAAWLALAPGLLYPELGVNRLPEEATARLAGEPDLGHFRDAPAFLQYRLGREVPDREDDLRAGAVVLVPSHHRAAFEERAAAAGLAAEPVLSWRAFATRRTFVNFVRPGVTGEETKRAFAERDLEGLMIEWTAFRLSD